MNKTTNNLINFSLGMLVISTFLLVTTPQKANADYNGYGYQSGGYSNGTNTNGNNNTTSNQINPMPIVYSVTPNSVDLNTIAGNMAVVLNGANFVQGSMAEFNNSYRPTNYTNSGQLTVILSVSDLATVGSNVITVFSPMPGGGNSNGVFFNIKTPVVTQPQNTNTAQNTNQNTPVIPLANTDANQNVSTVSPAPVIPAKTVKTNTDATTPKSTNEALAANSIFASGGFLPSTLTQWLLLLVLVILIVVFARKAFFEEKNKAVPLKHH